MNGGFTRALALALAILAVTTLAVTPSPAWAQAASPEDTVDSREPAPYEPDEFPVWMRRLRRGEVVGVGVFPLSLFVSRILYEYGRFAVTSFGGTGQDNRPWPFRRFGEGQFTRGESAGVVIGAVVVSVGVAIADAVVSRRRRATAEQTAPGAPAEQRPDSVPPGVVTEDAADPGDG